MMPERKIITGDCVEVMKSIADASIDAICCDPPYALSFMNQSWDRFEVPAGISPSETGVDFKAGATGRAHSHGLATNNQPAFQAWCLTWAQEALRVLKPGGYLLAFGGTRTYHRLACAIEDAGFEIRDSIDWIYGSGFPKSLDVSKAIDKAAGAEREVVGVKPGHENFAGRASGTGVGNTSDSAMAGFDRPWMHDAEARERYHMLTAPATDAAKQWEGFGTALKPSHEPIVCARKPLIGTVAENVTAHGVGALNIDACRIGSDQGRWPANVVFSHDERCVVVGTVTAPGKAGGSGNGSKNSIFSQIANSKGNGGNAPGEPVEVEVYACVLGCPVRALDNQTGILKSGSGAVKRKSGKGGNPPTALGAESRPSGTLIPTYGDFGGASRFFYCAKPSKAERTKGCEGGNAHPTVKPIELMRYLCRLVTPPGGIILDPFLGSGTTGIAAGLEGFHFVGIEREPDYVKIAEARIAAWEAT